MQMANANSIISGQFYQDAVGMYTINFGKTLPGRYIVYFEMTDESKELFAQNCPTSNRQYGTILFQWTGCSAFADKLSQLSARWNQSALSVSASDGNSFVLYADRIDVPVNSIGGNAYTLYPGYTYNYKIIPIE